MYNLDQVGRSGGKNKKSKSKTMSRSQIPIQKIGSGRRLTYSELTQNTREVLDNISEDVIVNDPALALALINHGGLRRGQINEDLPEGEYDPLMETTTDPAWIAANGTDQVDIANTDFDNLPQDIKENSLGEANLILSEWKDKATSTAHAAHFPPMGLKSLSREERQQQFFVPVAAILERQLDSLAEEIEKDLESGPGLEYYQEDDSSPDALYEEGNPYWPDGFVPRHQQILDNAEKDIQHAQQKLDSAESFISESKEIADHARWAAEKTGQSPEEVVKDIISDPSKYQDRIPAISKNRDTHSDDSWAIVSEAATKEITDPEKADQDAQKYIQSKQDELDKANISRDMKRMAIRNVPDQIISRANSEAIRAGHEKEMARRGRDEAESIASYAKWEAEQTGKSPEEVIEDIKSNPESYKAGMPKIAENIEDHTESSWQATISGSKDIISGKSENSLDHYEREREMEEDEALTKVRRRSKEKEIIQKVTYDQGKSWNYDSIYRGRGFSDPIDRA